MQNSSDPYAEQQRHDVWMGVRVTVLAKNTQQADEKACAFLVDAFGDKPQDAKGSAVFATTATRHSNEGAGVFLTPVYLAEVAIHVLKQMGEAAQTEPPKPLE